MIAVATDSNTVAKTYTWGLDLSGDLQGAGGVGGLLSVTEYNATGNDTYYPSYDANGNVSEYVDDTDNVVAHYEYSPFGKLTSSSGSKADDFNHRFSTKYLDDETALYYYGYRYYNTELGRWISRDPIEELGHEAVNMRGEKFHIWDNLLRLRLYEHQIVYGLRVFLDAHFDSGIVGSLNSNKIAHLEFLRETLLATRRLIESLSYVERGKLYPDHAGGIYRFVNNRPNLQYDALGEEPVTIACVVISFLGGYATGTGLYVAGEAVMEGLDSEGNITSKREKMIENPTNETYEEFQGSMKGGLDKAHDATVKGLDVGGTGLKGPPPAPATSGTDVTTDLINRGLKELNK